MSLAVSGFLQWNAQMKADVHCGLEAASQPGSQAVHCGIVFVGGNRVLGGDVTKIVEEEWVDECSGGNPATDIGAKPQFRVKMNPMIAVSLSLLIAPDGVDATNCLL